MNSSTTQENTISNATATHTPGPWEQSEDQKSTINAVFQGVWIKQGHMTLADVFTDIPEGKANARLIAAAPELLEALKAMEGYMDVFTEHYGRTGRGCDLLTQARAAIAKATT